MERGGAKPGTTPETQAEMGRSEKDPGRKRTKAGRETGSRQSAGGRRENVEGEAQAGVDRAQGQQRGGTGLRGLPRRAGTVAAAWGGKIKSRRKSQREGGRDPVQEIRRLRQKEEPRVRGGGGGSRRGGAGLRRKEGGRGEKGGRDRPEKESQKLAPAGWRGEGPSSQGH